MPETLDVNFDAAGIYVHVPFCLSKCPYCDFYSITDLDAIPDYLKALCLEIERCEIALPIVDTIYFGGGTPSTLTPRQIETIIDRLYKRFTIDPAAEITLETNPGTADPQKLSGFRSAGVNRLNIGLQSLDDESLRLLGRIHDAGQGRDAFDWARKAGFDNLGIDLIYGIPGQSEDRWAFDLSGAVGLGAEHLSCYTLTIEPGTEMSKRIKTGRMASQDEALTGDLFSFTHDFLSRHGYRQYEVSNYARVSDDDAIDYRSRHNRKYWNFAPYLGFGPAAHCFLDNRRWWNLRSLLQYLNAVESGLSPIAETESLNRDQQIIEYVYLSLRQTDGIDTDGFKKRFGEDFNGKNENDLAILTTEGLVEQADRKIRATSLGMRFLDRVVDRLIG